MSPRYAPHRRGRGEVEERQRRGRGEVEERLPSLRGPEGRIWPHDF